MRDVWRPEQNRVFIGESHFDSTLPAGTEQDLESSVYLVELLCDCSLLYIQTLCGRPSTNQKEVLGLSGSLCLKQRFDENMLRALLQIKLQMMANILIVLCFESAHFGRRC